MFSVSFPARADLTRLLEYVPDDAALVLGSNGFNPEDPAHSESKLASLLKRSDLPGGIAAVGESLSQLPRYRELLDRMPPSFRDPLGDPHGILARMPVVLFVNDVAPDPSGSLSVSAGLLFEPRNEAQRRAVGTALSVAQIGLINRHAPADRVQFVNGNSCLGLTVKAKVAAHPDESFGRSVRLQEALAQTMAKPDLLMFAEVPRVLQQTQALIGARSGDGDAANFGKVTSAMGLEGLGRAVWTAGFDQTQWRSAGWLEAPAPRGGVVSFLDQQSSPLPLEALQVTTPRTTWVHVSRLNVLGALVNVVTTRAAMNEGDGTQALMARAGGGAEEMRAAGLPEDLHLQLLTGLGDTWTFYSDPTLDAGGMAMVSKVNDPEKIAKVLASLQTFANTRMSDASVPFQITDLDMGNGIVIHALPLPRFAPAWSLSDGRLFVAGSAQAVLSAIENARPETGSILDAPRFKEAMARAGVDPASGMTGGFMYADLQRKAMSGYQKASMLLNLIAPAVKDQGVNLQGLLPPLPGLLEDLSPAVGRRYVDASGLHTWTLQPFPFSTLASGEVLFCLADPVVLMAGAGILLQEMKNRRESSASDGAGENGTHR